MCNNYLYIYRLWDCHTDDKDPTHQNQEWTMNSNGTFVSTMSGKCLEASTGNELFRNRNGECWILHECTVFAFHGI